LRQDIDGRENKGLGTIIKVTIKTPSISIIELLKIMNIIIIMIMTRKVIDWETNL
jgi:hypothetical protein